MTDMLDLTTARQEIDKRNQILNKSDPYEDAAFYTAKTQNGHSRRQQESYHGKGGDREAII
jgi:hypothetical protein